MRFRTENEIETFDFKEAYIEELRFGLGSFYMLLDNVKILETNSCNRDVRTMRTNGLELRISTPQILSFIEEGYKLYDANGELQQEVQDVEIEPEKYVELCKELEGATVYALEKEDQVYSISIDGEEREYLLRVQGKGDSEEWDRFMNLAEVM